MEVSFNCSGRLQLSLRLNSQYWLEVIGEEPQSLGLFPVNLGLLQAVADGYSYQVANEFGSLRLLLTDNLIDVRFEGRHRLSLGSKIDKENFVEILSKASRDEV